MFSNSSQREFSWWDEYLRIFCVLLREYVCVLPPRRGKGSLDSVIFFFLFVGLETPFLSSSMCAKEHLATKVLEQCS